MSENVTSKCVATETNQEPQEQPNASSRPNTTTEDLASVTDGTSQPTPGPSTRPIAKVRPAVVKPERGDVQMVPNSTRAPTSTLPRSLNAARGIHLIVGEPIRCDRLPALFRISDGPIPVNRVQRISSSSNVPSSSPQDRVQRISSSSNVPSSSPQDRVQRISSSSNVPSSSPQPHRCPITDVDTCLLTINRHVRELIYGSDSRIDELLYQAVREGRCEAVVTLLARGANVHSRGRLGMTLLHEAVRSGNIDMVELLLWHDVDVRARSVPSAWTALHWAAERGDYNIALMLIDAGADPEAQNDLGLTPIDFALLNGHEGVFAILDRCSNR